MNRALRRVSLACLAMFLLLLVNANYVQGFEAGKLADYPGNGRTFAQQYQYQRGSIITSDNVPIAASKHVPGIYSFQRYYPEGATYAPVTGYDTPYGKTGIEQAEDRLLAGTTRRPAPFWRWPPTRRSTPTSWPRSTATPSTRRTRSTSTRRSSRC